jgi:hypothetical protein
MLPRVVLLLVSCAALGAAAAAALRADVPQRTIPCSEVIDTTGFPYLGRSDPRYRFRLVLDAVSVPPAYLEQVSPTRSTPWTYFAKHGLVVRAGEEGVTISVPRAWRTRLGIVWGNAGHRVFHTIRIAGCPSAPGRGNAYAGGFFLRRASLCAPLVFTAGARSRTVWFGLGKRCPVRSPS